MSWTKGLVSQRFQPAQGRSRVSESRHVVVAGGGLAGLATGVVLAERGVEVTVVEAEQGLGGRIRGWSDRLADGSAIEMDRGFHAFFRHYYNLRDLMRRVDPWLGKLKPLNDYPILGPDGSCVSFTGLPTQTPWNIMSIVRRTSSLDLRALMRVNKGAALEMLRYESARTDRRYDDISAGEFLDSLCFPEDARRLLFEVFAHSFFNPEERMSAAEMLRMFHFYFTGNPEGLVFDVLTEPLGSGLAQPLGCYLEQYGAKVRCGERVSHIARDEGRWKVQLGGDETLWADGVVLALNVPGLQSVVNASPTLTNQDWHAKVESLGLTLPFAVWRLWLDRVPRAGRQSFVGTAGLGYLDNVSLYSQFQGQARDWALAQKQASSVVELHAYAVPENVSEELLREDLWRQFVSIYPEFSGAKVVEERFLRDQDCPSFDMGARAQRPGVRTPFPGLYLAGDFVRLPVPSALMEAAVTSGYLAANELLAEWGVQGTALESVPREGWLQRRRSIEYESLW